MRHAAWPAIDGKAACGKPSIRVSVQENAGVEASRTPEVGRRGWNWWILHIADIPWGLALAVVALPYLFLGMVVQGQAMLMAAGLFGIGHGVHTAAKIMKQ
jgi:hypothetical protein